MLYSTILFTLLAATASQVAAAPQGNPPPAAGGSTSSGSGTTGTSGTGQSVVRKITDPDVLLPNYLVDCPVWPNPSDTDVRFPPKSCTHISETTYSDGKVQIYSVRRDYSTNTKSRYEAVQQAVSLSLPYYQDLTSGFNVNFILPKRLDDGSFGATIAEQDANKKTVCYIVVAQEDGIALSKHTAVHEMYHCVVFTNRYDLQEKVKTDSLRWWFEGPANFFEYYMYPGNEFSRTEGGSPINYDPEEPLYEQEYPSCAFFQFLHNKKFKLKDINNWVNSHTDFNSMSNTAAERKEMAADAVLTGGFSEFAVAFHDKKVTFDSAKPAPIPIEFKHLPMRSENEDVNLPSEGASHKVEIRNLKTWTFKKWTVKLYPEQRVQMEPSWRGPGNSRPRVDLWYRKAGTKSWSKSIPKELHTGCDKSTVTYEFMVVPMSEHETVQGDLTFTRIRSKPCKKKCKVKRKGPTPIRRRQEDGEEGPSEEGGDGEKDEDEEEDCDSCVRGTWSVDKPSMSRLLQKEFSKTDAGIVVADVTGEYTMVISDPPAAAEESQPPSPTDGGTPIAKRQNAEDVPGDSSDNAAPQPSGGLDDFQPAPEPPRLPLPGTGGSAGAGGSPSTPPEDTDATFNAHLEVNNFRVNIQIPDDLLRSVDTVINMKGDAKIYQTTENDDEATGTETGKIVWGTSAVRGKATAKTKFGDFDIPVDGNYFANIITTYTCTDTTLEWVMTVNGVTTEKYSFNREAEAGDVV